MLVLGRKVGERLILGDREVTIQIVDVKGKNVRLGIIAPDDLPIHREEVYERFGDRPAVSNARRAKK